MNVAVIIALVQAAVIVLLGLDKWVHQVTGKASLEARVVELEQKVEAASKEFSKKWGEIQAGIGRIEMLQGRQDEHFKATDQRVEDLKQRIDRFHGTGL